MSREDLFKKGLAVFSKIGMVKAMGMELVAVSENECELAMTVDERHGNYVGGLHGGATAALMDTATFCPGALIPSGRKLTTEGFEIHIFRPVPFGERITARARIIRNGKRIVTVESTAWNEAGKQVAHAIATLVDVGG